MWKRCKRAVSLKWRRAIPSPLFVPNAYFKYKYSPNKSILNYKNFQHLTDKHHPYYSTVTNKNENKRGNKIPIYFQISFGHDIHPILPRNDNRGRHV